MSWVGSPTAVRIKSIVTRPALGILAAPILARVAVILEENTTIHHSVTVSSPPNHILHHLFSTMIKVLGGCLNEEEWLLESLSIAKEEG